MTGKEPESILRDEPRLLQAAMASSCNGVTIADANAPDMPLIYANDAFERITGYSRPEVLGRNCRFLHGGDRDQEGLQAIRQALAEGRSCEATLRNYRKDGALFWNELCMSPVPGLSGGVGFFVGIQNDVTRRVEAEQAQARMREELVASNVELERMGKLKDEFLGIAAHDLRSPLSAILLNTWVLDSGVPDPDGEQAQRAIATIRKSSDYMLHLIDSLLDVSEIETGKLSVQTERTDLEALIRELLEPHIHHAARKGISISLSAREKKVPAVEVDPRRFRQILDNLVSNATKFSPQGAHIEVRLLTGKGCAVVEVADTGPGIPEEDMDRLFQSFSRASVVPTGGEKSTGLGLMICHKIVEAHGGTISASSKVGKGTVFIVRLPLPGQS